MQTTDPEKNKVTKFVADSLVSAIHRAWQVAAKGVVARLVAQKKEDAGFARLIVGGYGPRDPALPFVWSNLMHRTKSQQPADINLNTDIYASPHVWGDVAARKTMDLFPSESLREITFEYVPFDFFADRSAEDCLDFLYNEALPGKAEPEIFIAATQAANIFGSLSRVLEVGGHICLPGDTSSLDIRQKSIFAQVEKSHLRIDAICHDDNNFLPAILKQKFGEPWHRQADLLSSRMIVLTKH